MLSLDKLRYLANARHLAAILFTDIVGYTALMQHNEANAVALIKHYNTVLRKSVVAHKGKILNFYGDGSLCAFPSAIEAVHCAIELQEQFRLVPVVPLRIGLHIGEITIEGNNALGDGVNIASRVQSLGIANSVLLSKEILDKIKNHPDIKTTSLGVFQFKNVDESMEIFSICNYGLAVPEKHELTGKLKENKKNTLTAGLLTKIIAGLLVLGILFFYLQRDSAKSFAESEKSIAVLPFKNMSNNEDNEYFADGMTDDIITQLSKITGLKVVSRTSTMHYKNSGRTIKQIAEELNVTVVLEGGVQRIGDKIRINAQLINATTDQHIWAENYDRSHDDIFEIQSDVARQIASQLRITLTSEEKKKLDKKPTEDIEAYELYLKARYAHNAYTQDGIQTAEQFYKLAIEKDPLFHEAYSWLAYLYVTQASWIGDLTTSEAKAKALRILNTAIGNDTTATDFHSLSGIAYHIDKNFTLAEYYCKRAISLAPNEASAIGAYAYILVYLKRNEEADRYFKKLAEISPVDIGIYLGRGENFYSARDFNQAQEVFLEGILLYPTQVTLYNHLSRAYLATNQYQKAVDVLNQGFKHTQDKPPSMLVYQAIAYNKLNRQTDCENLLTQLTQKVKVLEQNNRRPIDVYMAQYYSAVSDKEEAFQYLDRALKSNDVELIWLKAEPLFDNLRNDPRFGEYLKKAGF